MISNESTLSAVLSSVAIYSTVNILELMSLTPGLDDEDVRGAVETMSQRDLVKLSGSGDEQYVSLTNKGYDFLNSQSRILSAVS